MKIAVIGGGLFGVTAALELDASGHEVTLFEQLPGLLQAASGINQYRLHRGYHYPRSFDTIAACLASEESFGAYYGEALLRDNQHYYAIAKEKSKTLAHQFETICKKFGLSHTREHSDILHSHMLEGCYKVEEYLIDPDRLRCVCEDRLKKTRVVTRLSTRASADELNDFDRVVVSTYAAINDALGSSGDRVEYQFEICEKPVAILPESFAKKSIVVIDGPFMCIDPLGETGMHVMGNVDEAIYSRNTGLHPIIPEELRPFLNKGIIKNPPITRFDRFIEHAAEFMPAIREATHVGSMFTIRTVLPNTDATDTRPTIVHKVNDRVYKIFSGKLVNCVEAAKELTRLLHVESLQHESQSDRQSEVVRA